MAGIWNKIKELTKSTPKPMLKVGENPMLENLIDSFIEQGFYRFCISTFFKPDIIKDYFNDGSKKVKFHI